MESPIKTPVKTFSSTFFVPDKSVCVTCRAQHDRTSMFIFSKTGEHRSAYNAFHGYFHDCPLAEVQANWHTFLCRPCKRMLETWKQLKDKIREIEKSVMDKGQTLLPYEQEKRGLRSPCTPTNTPPNRVKQASKKLCFDLCSDGKSKVPSSRMKLTYLDEEPGLMRIDETSIMCEQLCSTPALTQPFRLELSLITPYDSSGAFSGSSVMTDYVSQSLTTPNESNTLLQTSNVTDSMAKSSTSSSALQLPSEKTNSLTLSAKQKIRREEICYRSSALMKKQSPIVTCLASGSIWKATNLIYCAYPEVVEKLINSIILKIPLGIYDKSENVNHEMTEIMEDLQKLVPGVRPEQALEEEIDRDPTNGRMRPIPVGGDQVSAERGRGVHRSCVEHDTLEERLEELFCMIEDFHEKMNYVELITQKYYTKDSVMQGGTLFQLKTLINRTNMTNDVRQHYHAASDFIDLVTECHVMAAAMAFLQMETTKSQPNVFPENLTNQSTDEKAVYLKEVVGQIVDRYIYHKLGEDVYRLHAHMNTDGTDQEDRIFNHASTLMTHGLIRKVTKMTTAAGDGERAVRNWKYALLAYNTTNKVKYRLEAFLLLASVTCLLPPRLREQVKWCRFVNITGGQFKNVDGDEAMEMLNNAAKKQIKNLGPNHSAEVVNRIGKTVKFTNDMARDLAWQVGGACNSRERTTPSLEKDREKIVVELAQTSKVFQYTPGREHETFRQQPSTIYGGIQAAQLHGWLSNRKKEYNQGKWAF